MADRPYDIDALLSIMGRLRDPETGCPWDRAQDFRDIVPSTLEECYELAAAIEDEDFPHVADEFGDLLFQVVFYARLGEERGLFDFHGIVSLLSEKLLRRHPHVFPDGSPDSTGDAELSGAEIKARWEEIKAQERRQRGQGEVLADVPRALPALVRAQKIQKRAARVGFDWQGDGALSGVTARLREELEELQAALAQGDDAAVAEELGDLMFSSVNLARHCRLDAESVLRAATRKFERRFACMEALARDEGESLEGLSVEAWERFWARAKSLTRQGLSDA